MLCEIFPIHISRKALSFWIVNAANLKAIPDNPANYVELKPNDKDIKKKIRRLIKVAKFFPACDFCDGRPYDATSSTGYDGKGIIEAGIQVSEFYTNSMINKKIR